VLVFSGTTKKAQQICLTNSCKNQHKANSKGDPILAVTDPKWKVTPVSGPRFWQTMSLQMVQYKCSNLQYPGDEKMCNTAQMNRKKHGTSDIGLIECDNHIKRVSYLIYLDEKNHEEQKDQALHWKYDAIEATFE
jgi:hypothetical protein